MITDKQYLINHLQYIIDNINSDKQISTDCIDNLLPSIERYNQNEAKTLIGEKYSYSFEAYKKRIKDGSSY